LYLLPLLAAACSSGDDSTSDGTLGGLPHDAAVDSKLNVDAANQDATNATDSSTAADSGSADASLDTNLPDASVSDSNSPDMGTQDASEDSSLVDSGMTDSSAVDSGKVDSGTIDSGKVDSGTVDSGKVDSGTVDSGVSTYLPYPTRTDYRIKGIQPDFWANKDELVGNNTGGVAMNLVWNSWEGNLKAPPCSASEELYDGHCFAIDAATDDAIADWTARGVVVTAVVYGVPAWARITENCSPVSSGFEIFCAPKNGADYGRFAGMLARRYDGKHGHGRIADFVIHNEVNANDWFDIGCGQGKACDQNKWLDTYAASYNAAYDRVAAEQPNDKVLVSLEHHFGTTFDAPAAKNPVLSGMTFLTGLVSRVGSRNLRVAYHPYPPDLLKPEFGADDFPRVTYGNIGVLSGWLQQTFPNKPSLAEIQLTESGVNSISPNSTQAKQADGVCKSLRNVLGTPGIENYIYHRMKDHSVETAAGLGLGLRDENGNAKAAWAVWALANRNDLTPPKLDCGFEDLPYIRLTRSSHKTRGHWASTRIAPSGFTGESSWRILRNPAADTKALYECGVGNHNMLSPDVKCEGQFARGPVGYIYTKKVSGSVALYRCSMGSGADHFISAASNCEGQTVEQTLGYVMP